MLGILIVTHGRLSETLLESAKMLIEDTSLTKAVCFDSDQGIEGLEQEVQAVLREMDMLDNIICFSDIPGGSPSRVLGGLLLQDSRLELITGVNLPLVVESLILRNSMSISELVNHLVQTGKDSIVNFGETLKNIKP